MAADSFFVQKTELTGIDVLEVGGSAAVEHHETLRDVLGRLSGPDVAELFAEPVFRRGNDAVPGMVSWYAHLPDKAQLLDKLDPQVREDLERVLRRKLGDVAEALRDPSFGPLVGAALHIRSSADILSLAGRPLIVNWGMLPDDVGRSPDARAAHFRSTLGRYLPLDTAPPLTSDDVRRAFAVAPAVTAPSAAAEVPGVEPAAVAETPTQPTAPPVPPTDEGLAGNVPDRPVGNAEAERWGWRWIPLFLLLGVTGVTLLLFLFTNVLIYPPEPKIPKDEIIEIARGATEALREERDRLQRALDEAVCQSDGTVVLPDDLIPGLGNTAPATDGGTGTSDGDDVAPEPARPTTNDLLPQPPERVNVPTGDGEKQNLLSYIEDRTALVLVQPDANVKQLGMGTGFFIAPDLLVTNDHVVRSDGDGATGTPSPDVLYVKSKALGAGLKAEILATSGNSEKFGPDFALLRVPGANAKFFQVWDSTESIKLQEMVAAGFPAAYFQIDVNQDKRFQIDTPEMVDMVMTRGKVNAQQEVGESATLALIHRADISKGNSGGPLVDRCGRVVGVNTFGIKDEVTSRWLNFSLHSIEMLAFLGEYRRQVATVDAACVPQIAPPTRPGAPAAEDPPQDGTPQNKDGTPDAPQQGE